MPRKAPVNKHGSQAGQQTKTEYYKSIQNYQHLVIKNDDITDKLKDIYDNNIWDLKTKFEELKEYYEQIGISDTIAWNEGIQYLDISQGIAVRQTSIQALKRGDYKAIATDRPNAVITEKGYAERILFYIKNFEPFKQFKGYDDFGWILAHNRLLYEILNYHNKKGNQLITVNGDLKTMIRAIKLVLQNPEDEIRWKYSALQIALGDLDRLKDDLNKIISVNELKSFIPYENLLDLVDYLEAKYQNAVAKLPDNIKNDFTKHPDDIVVFLNQVLIAVAINVLDYPSRLDKFDMDIIIDEDEIQPDKCYVMMTNPITFIFNNDKKHHKPLKYKLNAKPILGLNKRLNNMLYESITKYPRNTLFIKKDSWSSKSLTPVSASTVCEWIRNIVYKKTLNIGTFRSSFVSYYYPKSNNLDKKIMVTRMRTSVDELNRAYLKFYNTPDTLVQVKIDPSQDLINRANSGQSHNPINVNNNNSSVQIKPDPDIPTTNTPAFKKLVNIQDKRKEIAKKWYADPFNREEHKARVRENSKKPETYRNRYIRELNSGRMDISRIKPQTIEKYNIIYQNGIYI